MLLDEEAYGLAAEYLRGALAWGEFVWKAYDAMMPTRSAKECAELTQRHGQLVAPVLHMMGKTMDGQGLPKSAHHYYDKATEVFTALYGRRHPFVAAELTDCAAALSEMGEFERALLALEEAHEIHGKVYKNIAAQRYFNAQNDGNDRGQQQLQQQQQQEKEEQEEEEELDENGDVLKRVDPGMDIANTAFVMGRVLERGERLEDAEIAYEDAVLLLERRFGLPKDDPSVVLARQALENVRLRLRTTDTRSKRMYRRMRFWVDRYVLCFFLGVVIVMTLNFLNVPLPEGLRFKFHNKPVSLDNFWRDFIGN
eukprot:TRINITY_DN66220_c3_g1_i2.p1 TRINITY_DN66220_c3_g1~~TRINITY_DN66220_c3_g1_i2.p1  ORF type:complete len:311 (-),score=168.56 TRINITY_DN66220_c3_g1_i2:28-960(-)